MRCKGVIYLKLRDKKITIYRQKDMSEPGGMPKMKYQPIHPGKLWAYVRQTSGTEVFYSSGEYSNESMIFTIGWREDIITLEDFVEHKGVFYNIRRVDTYEGYKDAITLTCDRMTSQPESESIVDYHS